MDLGRLKGYTRQVEITIDPTKEKDCITGEKLNRVYMKVTFTPMFKTTEGAQVYLLNEASTPKDLKSHWWWFNDKRQAALKSIKDKMNRYFIVKKEI